MDKEQRVADTRKCSLQSGAAYTHEIAVSLIGFFFMNAHKSSIQENGPYSKKSNQLVVRGEIVQNCSIYFNLLETKC